MLTNEIQGQSRDCALYEQIVILFPYFKVLSKEQRSRLKEWPLNREFGACSLK
jgi:hypothetical protein